MVAGGSGGSLLCCPLRPLFSHFAGVQSALYGLVLSLLICIAAVAVFTTHVLLLLPVLLSILGTCQVVGTETSRALPEAQGSKFL
jgi:hypothetical protein